MKFQQEITPKLWLEDCYKQLQNIFESFNNSMMMSAIVGLLEEDTGHLTYFNAEHPWLVLYRNGKSDFVENEKNVGKKLGTMDSSGVFIQSFQMLPGDVLFMGSDGKDDIKTGSNDETGQRIINEDETAFLKHVEEGGGVIENVVERIYSFGEITDDLSICRISYTDSQVNG